MFLFVNWEVEVLAAIIGANWILHSRQRDPQCLGKSWLRRLNTLIPFCTLEQPVRDVQEESILTVGHREDSHES